VELAIERLTGLAFLAVGLSHVLRPRGWVDFFAQLRARGEPGAFVNGMMSLAVGTLIVAFHGSQWTGWAAVTTFLGWGQLTKGFVHLCFPAYSLRSMATVSETQAWKFVLAGAIMLPVAGVILAASLR
jgi:uncharacterized protein YjeT (DUF2065 family)